MRFPTFLLDIDKEVGAFLCVCFSVHMATHTSTVDDVDPTRSEAPSTCGDWPVSDEEEEEEEVIVVGDVATILANDNVKQVDVCDDENKYNTAVVEDHDVTNAESEMVTKTRVAYEVEVEWEQMPQTQDVLVPQIVEDFKNLAGKDRGKAKQLLQDMADAIGAKLIPEAQQPAEDKEPFKAVRLRLKSVDLPEELGDAPIQPTRKSGRNGKRRMQMGDASGVLEIIGLRDAEDHKHGSDFLVKDGDSSSWIYEDFLRETDRGCEAMEIFDKKRSRK